MCIKNGESSGKLQIVLRYKVGFTNFVLTYNIIQLILLLYIVTPDF